MSIIDESLPALQGNMFENIPPESWMSYVLQDKPLKSENRAIPQTVLAPTGVGVGGAPVGMKVISLDIGNDAAKLGIVDRDLHFRWVRIPATYQPAQSIRHGNGKVEFKVTSDGAGGGETFWIGEDALGGDSLPIGPTRERLADIRYLRFIKAALVECLIAGGYKAGEHHIALGLGLRNEEIEEREGIQVLERQTLEVLRTLKSSFDIERKDGFEESTRWKIVLHYVYPAAQTLGSFFAWYWKLSGEPAQQDIHKLAILDYGSGDTHLLEVEYANKRLIATGERLGAGTVEIANGLIQAVKQRFSLELTVAAAQKALRDDTILVGGRTTNIIGLVHQLKLSRVQNLLGRTTPVLQNRGAYLMHSGGGAILMHNEIEERMQVIRRASRDYLIVPTEVASILNCIGLYAFAYYRLTTSLKR